jgi:tetratricopeptide (TPR) repeat protein
VSNPTDGCPALPPEIAGYATEHFVLAEELDRLSRVQRIGAVEAEIFYASRLLEVLAAEALRVLPEPVTPNVFANLEVLQQLGLLPAATGQWAHALRRTGNAVRHVWRRVGRGDAEVATLFAERWLVWFFREFAHGPRLPGLAPDALCLHPAGDASRGLLRALEEGRCRPDDMLRPGPALAAPALPAVAAEILLGRKDLDGAHAVLTAALAAFPDDLRLNQLLGLYWSRTGDLERARALLEPLHQKYRDDDETTGIVAGVYKRLWLADRSRHEWLQRSHKAYAQGWKRSRHSNAYLGINAATTALWLGRDAAAGDSARAVRGLLNRRAELLARGRGSGQVLGYWDQVTLAEALVLLRDLPAARAAYRAALERPGSDQGNVDVTRSQLEHLLQTLGLPDRAEDFLHRPPPAGPGRA